MLKLLRKGTADSVDIGLRIFVGIGVSACEDTEDFGVGTFMSCLHDFQLQLLR